MRKEEKRVGGATHASPFDATYKVEFRSSEGEGTAIEQNASTTFVYLPESASVGTILVPPQEVAMLIHSSEFQHSVLIDDEFLIHVLVFIDLNLRNLENVWTFWFPLLRGGWGVLVCIYLMSFTHP